LPAIAVGNVLLPDPDGPIIAKTERGVKVEKHGISLIFKMKSTTVHTFLQRVIHVLNFNPEEDSISTNCTRSVWVKIFETKTRRTEGANRREGENCSEHIM